MWIDREQGFMVRRKNTLGALAIVLAGTLAAGGLGVVAPATAAAVESKASVPSRWQAPSPRTITLITGDRITSYGEGRISADPRPGVRFLSYRVKGHQYVIPADALPLLRANRLDRRLFDVTGLLDAGYDRRADLPLIVAGGAAPRGLVAQRRLSAVDGFATTVPTDKLAGQWAATRTTLSKGKLWLDGLRKVSLDVSVPQIGAPAAWAAGFDGTGIKVAVLDTGIDATHPDLAGKVSAERNFASDFEDERDYVGHGTHVASTIVGSGAASSGRYRGVAPGATLLDGKVCFQGGCAESWILRGMQWAAESGADIVNMSLGGGRVDVVRAIGQTITTSPASVTFGLQEFPHDDDPVLTRQITYHNPTTTSITLSLGLTTTAPADIFSLSSDSVTVPAGGTASVDLAADTRNGGDVTGGLGGQVTATASGGVRVQTSFGVLRDIPRVHAHVTTTSRSGTAPADLLTVLINTSTFEEIVIGTPDAVVQVTPGAYFAFSYVVDADGSLTMLVRPQVTLDADADVVMDGTQARGYDVTVPNTQAAPLTAIVDVAMNLPVRRRGALHRRRLVHPALLGAPRTAERRGPDRPGDRVPRQAGR